MAAPAQPKKIVAPTVSQINAEFVTQVRLGECGVCAGGGRAGRGGCHGERGLPALRGSPSREDGPEKKVTARALLWSLSWERWVHARRNTLVALSPAGRFLAEVMLSWWLRKERAVSWA